MDIRRSNVFIRMETTCESLLYELQEIWDEVGEAENERDNMLFQVEKECLEAYRRKVDQAYQYRAHLRQTIADAEAELAAIFSALGERPANFRQPDQKALNLKEELTMIVPFLEEMKKKKGKRKKQFVEVLGQIANISNEMHRSPADRPIDLAVDEEDLSLKRLEELHSQLLALQKAKIHWINNSEEKIVESDRLKQLLDNLNALNCLCIVLGMDFKDKLNDIHPTLDDSKGTKNISDDTLGKLSVTIQNLKEIKIQRLQRLQDLASAMLELWNLMDTPSDEQYIFHNVTSKIAALEHEVTEPNCLSVDFINHVEAEVLRLEKLKSTKMKDLILKKRSELEEICHQSHMVLEAQSVKQFSIEAIDSGAIDPSSMLEQIEFQISEAKEATFSRKDILERVEKWKAACEEESWLEEYNRDEYRYNGGRGGHLSLKRAEKARALVNKIPAMVETLTSKTRAWEKERGAEFFYDGVKLLSMLEDYSILRQEKEKERQRQRDQRKLYGRLVAEQETLFGSKPSPTKSSRKAAPRYSIGNTAATNKRYSLGGSLLQKPYRTALQSHPIKKLSHNHHNNVLNHHQNGGKGNNVTSGHLQKKGRKPFSPLPGTPSVPVNKKNTPEKQELEPPKAFSVNRTPRSTPTRMMSDEVYGNGGTPKKSASPVSSTLSTRSATPYTPATVRVGQVVNDGGNFEHSFEEIRAGFVLPQRTVCSALQF